VTYTPAELPPTEAVRTALATAPASTARRLEWMLALCLVRDAHDVITDALIAAEKAAFDAEWADYPDRFEHGGILYRKDGVGWCLPGAGILGGDRRVGDADVRDAWAAKSGAAALRVQG
jgi:hypothetical protein